MCEQKQGRRQQQKQREQQKEADEKHHPSSMSPGRLAAVAPFAAIV